MKKHVLIVSYVFPPQPGVGGRRWAKFAKYLSRKGYDIDVLCCENVTNVTSEWISDVKGIRVKYLPLNFPKVLLYPSNSILDKLKYRFYVNLLQAVDRGNFYDRTIFWKKQIQEEISALITNKKIDCVIVTSGPFRLSYYVTQLKNKFPDVKFIADFRDLWTEDTEITSFSSISLKRKNHEKKLEKETVHLADHVITTVDKITDYFSSLNISNKFVTISNGFDNEDFPENEKDPNSNSDKISIVYAGTLYLNLQYILEPFFKALGEIKKNNQGLYKRLKIEFIGNFPNEYLIFLIENDLIDIISLHAKLPLKEVFSKINNSNYCMLILNNVYNFNLSTKFYEYVSRKKKILVVSSKGDASEYIEKNKLGHWINPKTAYNDLINVLSKPPVWESELDINDFSVERLTDKLEVVINAPYSKKPPANTKHLLLTFDYELFLGEKSGSVENCMIKPTNEILAILKKYKTNKALFFVDTTYLLKLKENITEVTKKDYNTIIKQLIKIIQDGHFVFPHLHPHWKDAIYNKEANEWKLEKLEFYRFHNLDESEKDKLFSESISLIKEIQKEAGVNYEIDAYRAGGWCLQPFKDFLPYFRKYGIKYDFSVLRGFSKFNNLVYYNYRNAPLKKIYRFTNEVEKQEKEGEFYEFSISSLDEESEFKKFMEKVINKYLWLTEKKSNGGLSIKLSGELDMLTDENLDPLQYRGFEMASIELFNIVKLKLFKNHFKENDYLHLISHPKMITNHNLKVFDDFMNHITAHYEVNTEYKKMTGN